MEEIIENVNNETVETAIEVVEKSFGKKAAKGCLIVASAALAGYAMNRFVVQPLRKKLKEKKAAKDAAADAEVVDNVKVMERDFLEKDSED